MTAENFPCKTDVAPGVLAALVTSLAARCRTSNPRQVYLTRGIPGAGKTELAKELGKDGGTIVSADDYFMVGGEYRYDREKIRLAHADCFRRFLEKAHLEGTGVVVVDNTNGPVHEMSPYVLAALAYGRPTRVVTVHVPLSHGVERNLHGVPVEEIRRLYSLMEPGTPFPEGWDRVDLDPTGAMSGLYL